MACDDQELPGEMMFEILSRTSLKTLDTCKVVCKGWKQLTYDPSFMPVYCNRTNNLSGYFIQTFFHNKYLSTFVSILSKSEAYKEGDGCTITSWPCDGTKILASSNQGICCCERRKKHRNRRYYACKPATQQWQALPNPKLRHRTAGVAILVWRSSPYLRYVIVRLSHMSVNQYLCEVFDSDTWAWRSIQGGPVNLPDGEFIFDSEAVVSVGGTVYWLTSQDNVLMLDVFEELFDKFSLPEPVHGNDAYKCRQLLECEGRLGLTCVTCGDENMELWLTEGPKNYKHWTRKMSVNIGIAEKKVCYPSRVGFYSSQIAFIRTYRGALFYKLQDCNFIKAITEVELGNEFRFASQVFRFRSDLEMVNLKGGR